MEIDAARQLARWSLPTNDDVLLGQGTTAIGDRRAEQCSALKWRPHAASSCRYGTCCVSPTLCALPASAGQWTRTSRQTLICLQAAQSAQALCAAVLLSCAFPIAPDDSCQAPAVPGAPAAPAAPPPRAPAATAAGSKKRALQRSPELPQQRRKQQHGGSDSCPPSAAHELDRRARRQARKEAKEERRRQRQARRAAKEERRRQRQQRRTAEGEVVEEEEVMQQQEQHEQQHSMPQVGEEPAGHPRAVGALQAAPAAPEPQAAAAAAAAGEAAQQQQGPDLYRFWAPTDVERLLRCVGEPECRRRAARLGGVGLMPPRAGVVRMLLAPVPCPDPCQVPLCRLQAAAGQRGAGLEGHRRALRAQRAGRAEQVSARAGACLTPSLCATGNFPLACPCDRPSGVYVQCSATTRQLSCQAWPAGDEGRGRSAADGRQRSQDDRL